LAFYLQNRLALRLHPAEEAGLDEGKDKLSKERILRVLIIAL
jgi:hypothetical protein